MARSRNSSLSLLQIVTIIAVILIVIAVVVWSLNSPDRDLVTPPNQPPQTTDPDNTPSIEDNSDLQSAEQTLEDVNLDNIDTSEIDALDQELPQN